MAIQVISTVALFIIALAGSTAQANMTNEMRKDILDKHNMARRSIKAANMQKLEYDLKLEAVARNYINRMKIFRSHNTNAEEDYAALGGNADFGVGENHWALAPNLAVWGWTDAKLPSGCSLREMWIANLYSPDPNAARNKAELWRAKKNCSKSYAYIGWNQYSQVMWAQTNKVGCWYTEKFGTLCNYSPQGNIIRYNGKQQPYVIYGKPCSECPHSAPDCQDGLCIKSD